MTVSASTRLIASAVATEGASGLGDLTSGEVGQIQGVVDSAGRPLNVVGSAARGARRGIGSDVPIGKGAGTRSDIDYVVPPGRSHSLSPFPSRGRQGSGDRTRAIAFIDRVASRSSSCSATVGCRLHTGRSRPARQLVDTTGYYLDRRDAANLARLFDDLLEYGAEGLASFKKNGLDRLGTDE